jgi:hypothetical protein
LVNLQKGIPTEQGFQEVPKQMRKVAVGQLIMGG